MFWYDSTMLILIPAMILAGLAQYMVTSNYNKFSKFAIRKGYTGRQVAEMLLKSAGIHDVEVLPVQGQLTDHYDPRTKNLMLSSGVFNSSSISAVSIAAHETGHAMQHNLGYIPLNIRSAIVPAANISSQMAVPIFILGMFLGNSGYFLMQVGIFLFMGAVIFQVITLPVEFNASRRAIKMLADGKILEEDEIAPAKKVLSAAAMTYVASAFMAMAQLLRLIILANGRRRD